MADISIDPTKGGISIKIEVSSLQDVGYDIQLVDNSWKVLAEFNGALGSTIDHVINAIGISANLCIGCYINAVIEIADPNGAGNNYNVVLSVIQNGSALAPAITLNGVTTNNEIKLYPQFKLI